MDELAALMEDESAAQQESTTGMDELASLMMDAVERESDPATQHEDDSEQESEDEESASQQTSRPLSSATTSVDEQLGIRMTNRHISSIDLLDMITINPFASPAKISAMSLRALCGILVDPPSVIDQATVSGKTQLVTVGIVFENSGTKTSSKGGAFCILKIGNLQSGPCLSIFLFGAAYSKYCRQCRPGQVVAIVNAKLLPLRQSGGGKHDTRVTLSIHDPSQLVAVAKARDYGMCKAKVKARQADGVWRSDAGHCRNYVDKRMGDFCETHCKQKKDQPVSNLRVGPVSSGGSSQKSGAGNLVQQYKADKSKRPALVQPSGSQPYRAIGSNRFSNAPNNPHSALSNCVPKHMKRQRDQPVVSGTTQVRSSSTSTNSLLNGTRGIKQNPYTSSQKATKKPKKQLGIVGTGDWMQEATARRKPATTSLAKFAQGSGVKRSLNTAGGGFDGSVAVPAPSNLFSGGGQRGFTHQRHASKHQGPSMDQIKSTQSQIAQQLHQQKAAALLKSKSKRVPPKPSTGTTGNIFLDSIKVDNIDAILSARSKFADEADAEEYAKNRQRVVELEELESKQEKRNTKDKENQRLTSEWVCLTCKDCPRFKIRPKRCYAADHNVKVKRILRETTTKEDERTKLHQRSSVDGGLVLSRGLDWSKNRYDRFS